LQQGLWSRTHAQPAMAGVVGDGEDLNFHGFKLLKANYQPAARRQLVVFLSSQPSPDRRPGILS
jgi:hypothetical protein